MDRRSNRDYDRDSIDGRSRERQTRFESSKHSHEERSRASNLESSHRSRIDDEWRTSRKERDSGLLRSSLRRRSTDRASFKEDASVQASFSVRTK